MVDPQIRRQSLTLKETQHHDGDPCAKGVRGAQREKAATARTQKDGETNKQCDGDDPQPDAPINSEAQSRQVVVLFMACSAA